MKREQTFDLPHKGLRAALAELGLSATGSDFENAEELRLFENLFRDVWQLIALHSAEEERIIFAELEKRAPGATVTFASEHRALDAAYDFLAEAVETTKHLTAKDRFVADLNKFSAALQTHMNREEDELQPLIWKYFSDEELMEHRRAIMAASDPESLLKWFRFVFYALNGKETAEFLDRLKSMFPETTFIEARHLAEVAEKRRRMRL